MAIGRWPLAISWLTQYRTENLVSLRKLGNLEKIIPKLLNFLNLPIICRFLLASAYSTKAILDSSRGLASGLWSA